MMVTRGLLVRLDVKPGKDGEVETFLRGALPLVNQESATSAWFALRFGRNEYGIFDAFADDAGRDAHLAGAVAKALMEQSDALFTKQPQIQRLNVLAYKMPGGLIAAPDTKGLLLTFKAKSGNEGMVQDFLRDAMPMVQQEPKTTAWFAIQLEGGIYGIFDVFSDNAGRFTHLTGQVPRELALHALSFFGGMPEMTLIDVIAEKLAA
jgi:quinol monooxygenase YgiN